MIQCIGKWLSLVIFCTNIYRIIKKKSDQKWLKHTQPDINMWKAQYKTFVKFSLQYRISFICNFPTPVPTTKYKALVNWNEFIISFNATCELNQKCYCAFIKIIKMLKKYMLLAAGKLLLENCGWNGKIWSCKTKFLFWQKMLLLYLSTVHRKVHKFETIITCLMLNPVCNFVWDNEDLP